MTHVKDLFRLDASVALITGGAGHLGFAMSLALAEAGATVVLAGRDGVRCASAATEIEKTVPGAVALGIQADLRDRKAARDLMSAIRDRVGRLDILVNNAYYGSAKALDDLTDEDWAMGIDGSVGTAFRCTVEALPLLRASRGGAIVNVGSMYGLVSPDPAVYAAAPAQANPANYGAGKAALLQFTRYAAIHLAREGIRVNSLTPGPFPAPERITPGFRQALTDKVPLKRLGSPDDLKGAIVFLVSQASGFMTGANLVVDGGWTAW